MVSELSIPPSEASHSPSDAALGCEALLSVGAAGSPLLHLLRSGARAGLCKKGIFYFIHFYLLFGYCIYVYLLFGCRVNVYLLFGYFINVYLLIGYFTNVYLLIVSCINCEFTIWILCKWLSSKPGVVFRARSEEPELLLQHWILNISKAATNEILASCGDWEPLKQEWYLSVMWLSDILVAVSHCLHPLVLLECWECCFPCVYPGLQVLDVTCASSIPACKEHQCISVGWMLLWHPNTAYLSLEHRAGHKPFVSELQKLPSTWTIWHLQGIPGQQLWSFCGIFCLDSRVRLVWWHWGGTWGQLLPQEPQHSQKGMFESIQQWWWRCSHSAALSVVSALGKTSPGFHCFELFLGDKGNFSQTKQSFCGDECYDFFGLFFIFSLFKGGFEAVVSVFWSKKHSGCGGSSLDFASDSWFSDSGFMFKFLLFLSVSISSYKGLVLWNLWVWGHPSWATPDEVSFNHPKFWGCVGKLKMLGLTALCLFCRGRALRTCQPFPPELQSALKSLQNWGFNGGRGFPSLCQMHPGSSGFVSSFLLARGYPWSQQKPQFCSCHFIQAQCDLVRNSWAAQLCR